MVNPSSLIRDLVRKYPLIALIPAVSVIFDYSMTLLFSHGSQEIMELEYSPLVRFAVAHDLLFLYLAGMVLFYYACSYLALRVLSSTEFYGAGVALVLLVGLTHLAGGLSWFVRDGLYSQVVIGLALSGVLIAVFEFGRVLHNHLSAASV